jgi:hypothetical protein
MPVHGDVVLYGTYCRGEYVRCVARFTHGRMECLRGFEELSEDEQGFLIDLHDG